jgi:hypothetical protein
MGQADFGMAARRWWSVRWTRVVGLLLIVWVGLWVLMLPAAHIMAWYTAKSVVKDDPRAALELQALPDSRVGALGDGLTVSRFGYSFQVPWTKAVTQNDWKTVYVMGFEDGSSLMIEDPANHMDILSAAHENEAEVRKGLQQLLGEDAVRSHYEYAEAELGTLPAEISFFHSRRRNARAMTLLMMKSLEIPEKAGVIYNVSSAQVRGFQFGDPGKAPTLVELLLFDKHDRALKLTLRGPRGGMTPVLTQEQINGVVASVRVPN